MVLDLGPRARRWLCGLLFGGEGILVATAPLRSDRSYGFRMFQEWSSVTVHLSRRLRDGRVVPVESTGRWQARDCRGQPHRFGWAKMVHAPAPHRLDVPGNAPYGIEDQVRRTAAAMRWVAAHTGDDCETAALIAHLAARQNLRRRPPIRLEVARGP
jgi:hypothetical protein